MSFFLITCTVNHNRYNVIQNTPTSAQCLIVRTTLPIILKPTAISSVAAAPAHILKLTISISTTTCSTLHRTTSLIPIFFLLTTKILGIQIQIPLYPWQWLQTQTPILSAFTQLEMLLMHLMQYRPMPLSRPLIWQHFSPMLWYSSR